MASSSGNFTLFTYLSWTSLPDTYFNSYVVYSTGSGCGTLLTVQKLHVGMSAIKSTRWSSLYVSSNYCKQHILPIWSCMWYLFCSYMFSKADNQKYLSTYILLISKNFVQSLSNTWKSNSFVKERGMKFCTQYHNNRTHVKTIVLHHLGKKIWDIWEFFPNVGLPPPHPPFWETLVKKRVDFVKILVCFLIDFGVI